MNSYEEYSELDLVDMFKTIFSKWKKIILFSLLCGAVACLCGLYFANKPKASNESIIKKVVAEMTEEDKVNVENSAKIINEYRDMYDKQKDYCDNSVYQHLDPYAIKSTIITYYVDNHYQVSYPIIQENNTLVPIVQTYASVISKDALYENLVEEINSSINPVYIKEVVTASTTDKDVGVFTVKIYADSDNLLDEITKYVKGALEEASVSIKETYGEHDLVVVSEVKGLKIDTDVALAQQNNVKTLTTISDEIALVEKAYTGNQLTYLKLLVHEEIENETSVLLYTLIGLALGCVGGALWFALKYLVSNSVKTESELNIIVGADSFGNIINDKMFVAAKIDNAVVKNGIKNVAIVTDVEDTNVTELANVLTSKNVVSVNPLDEKEAFEKLVSCDAAIFVVTLKNTNKNDIISLKNMCKDSNIKILGSLIK